MTLAIDARGITKAYGPLVAVDRADFELRKAEIHVLLGANGCGKSSLCKVIAGALRADSGSVRLHGIRTAFQSPLEARRSGIATVYQELSLNSTQTVVDNIYLGNEPRKGLFIDRKTMRAQAKALLASLGDLGCGVEIDALIGDMTNDKCQIVEVAKALVQNPSVILFDESTSSMDRSQVRDFFVLVRRLRDAGCSIIFISHRMEEIFEIGDRVTVMRDGRCIGTEILANTDRDRLVAMMVGEEHKAPGHGSAGRTGCATGGDPILRVEGLGGPCLGGVTFDLSPGEVLGLGGLHGQGQSNLLLTLFGSRPIRTGGATIAGRSLSHGGPHRALRAGLSYVSGDRGRDGLLHGRPILENLTASLLSKEPGFAVNPARLRARIAPIIERIHLKYGGYDHEIGSLSGGNQQKVVIARALASAPRILLLDDPTKGIDVHAKSDLFDLVRELCAAGMAVILYSSEDSELLENADRVLVFNSGSVVDSLAGERLNELNLYRAALGNAA